jgi:hypothetical protein
MSYFIESGINMIKVVTLNPLWKQNKIEYFHISQTALVTHLKTEFYNT